MGHVPEKNDNENGAAGNSATASQDYKTGYRHPPRDTQFKKGQSGNPDGRPKKVKRPLSFVDEFRAIFLKPIIVNESGHRTKITKRQLVLTQLVNKAIHGDLKAFAMILRIMQTFSSELAQDASIITAGEPLSMPVRKISLEKLERECYRRFGPSVFTDTAFGSCPGDGTDTTPQGQK